MKLIFKQKPYIKNYPNKYNQNPKLSLILITALITKIACFLGLLRLL